MPSLTIKDIPDGLFERLKQAAQREHRSLNKQIIACLERTLALPPVDAGERLARAKQIRAKTAAVILSAKDIQQAKERGRR